MSAITEQVAKALWCPLTGREITCLASKPLGAP